MNISLIAIALILVLVADVALVMVKRLSTEVGIIIGVLAVILLVMSTGVVK